MRSILVVLAAILTCAPVEATQTASDSVEVVGEFSNMRFTEEHAYGYSVQLWRHGDKLLGLFLASEGLAGDTPTGLLDALVYHPSSGRLSFKAKLTTGVVLLAGGKQEPSRELFEFIGTLKGGTISGNLKRLNMLRPDLKPVSERVLLRKTSGEILTRPATYAEWKHWADEILKLRGPRW